MGPQTPGELKQRTDRLHPFADLAAVEDTLLGLIDRELVRGAGAAAGAEGAAVRAAAGRRGRRGGAASRPAPAPRPPEPDRLGRLEAEVAALRRELAALKQELGT